MNKAEIRKQQLSARQALSVSDYQVRTRAVTGLAMDFILSTQATFVHLFLPIVKNREVDTWPLYQHLLEGADQQPVVSKTHFKTKSLSHHPMQTGDELVESRYGIPEPTHNRLIDPKQIDLVFVPLLAFDLAGNRVGYGAGLYDRFLADCRPDIPKVGLSILPPQAELIEVGEFDIPLDYCISPEKVYDFSCH